MTQDDMVGKHHRLNGHEFEQASGDGKRQGSLVAAVLGILGLVDTSSQFLPLSLHCALPTSVFTFPSADEDSSHGLRAYSNPV